MATDNDQSAKLVAALRSALKENARLRERNRALEAGPEPIAIIGMACRLPGGVDSPEDLWDLVSQGREALGPLPRDRGWDLDALSGADGSPPLSATDQGGFLEGVADFDADFFGISPKEAAAMDPQQRHLLEVSWEALERAGIDPASLADSETGVYMGVSAAEYGPRMTEGPPEGHLLTGTYPSVASGRVAYQLGLRGPALTVDTACSSSLVAVHLAVRALREGTCTMALAGGATVMSTPGLLAEFTRKQGLAPDGRCKAFGAGADGTGFSEGAGVVVLERLSDARRNGHPVLALLRGSAINQDGASNGLTAPNGPAQVRVVRSALDDAGLGPTEVDAVEAHGTGTTLGDPIEARALIEAYGPGRERPLVIGSLKSNIGHTQAAAGVSGLIKAVCALRHGSVPPTLHADEPTPHVDWSGGTVVAATTTRPLEGSGRPARMGVSSFGISGTNAHVIIESAAVEEPPTADTADPAADLPFVMSARTGAALRAMALRLADHVRGADGRVAPAATARALATTRAGMEHRAVVLARDNGSLAAGAAALAAGTPDPRVVTGRVRSGAGTAFVYPGQGVQRPGMGRDLYRAHPAFARSLDELADAFDQYLDRPLRSVMWAEPGTADAALLDETLYTQAGVFTIGVALTRLLETLGLVPDFVFGHSGGELAAAHVAGVLSLEDAVALMASRGRTMQDLPQGGAMVAVQAAEDEVRPLLAGTGGAVSIAAVNSPRDVVLSGEEAAVTALAERLAHAGRRTRRLRIPLASHCALVDPALEPYGKVADSLTYHPPRLPIVSNLSGVRAGEEMLTGHYWVRNMREAVRFSDGVAHLYEAGVGEFVEVGPESALASMITASLPEGAPAQATALLGGRLPETRLLTEGLAALYTRGAPVDWTGLLPGAARTADLPTYPFQRRRYWMSPPSEGRVVVETGAAAAPDRGRSYQDAWVPVSTGSSATVPGTWLLFERGDRDPAVSACVASLERRGHTVTPVSLAGPADRATVVPAVSGRLAGALLATALAPALEGPSLPSETTAHRDAVAVLQALGDAGTAAPLWCLTRGAVTAGREVTDPAGALLWGLGTVAAREHPDRWGGLVDLPAADGHGAGEVLAEILDGGVERGEDRLAVRDGRVFARRLAAAPLDTTAPVRDWKPRGTVLVTGGTGGLGARTAQWLAEQGAEHLLLVSRRGPDAPGGTALADRLRAAGARVSLVACDVADRDALARVLADIPEDAPLDAVFHTAAELDDAALDNLRPEQIGNALRVKADGAVHLHSLTRHLDLSAFVLYSSVTSLLGMEGQGNYAPGNAFCEALAHHRRAQGLPATSVSWGTWADSGMAEREGVTALLRGHGLPAMAPEKALRTLRQGLDRDVTALAIAEVDGSALRSFRVGERRNPLVEGLYPPAGGEAREPADAPGSLTERLAGRDRAGRVLSLTELVCDQVAAVLGHTSGAEVEADRNLKDLGLDSASAVVLRNRLSGLTGLRLPAAIAFDRPSCAALARDIEERMFGDPEQAVMTGLDGLEAALREFDGADGRREAVADRLRRLLDRLSPPPLEQADVDRDLESVSREELFAFIDDTLRD
ncbi:type I polyketide synthase [Nocardiopsis changdeensis]|uniref:SDR family NAD(P)-dependent oxidoreductase n=1 Tax=Nocardiopsis changdeensis TaxID=2831969 RepID=A0ABX8BKR7_9ACTN|nr:MULTISPECIES: type I polyketide synthase [Nocardiopsis]QUX21622.1 SDR family NAD(P)-dependent oxidoreductase [Nocardiopsis changdeensis]QYX37557.1 SDR family NAD(P)-dependent oxidoreductase [Nocardiopsis sp. MT53]